MRASLPPCFPAVAWIAATVLAAVPLHAQALSCNGTTTVAVVPHHAALVPTTAVSLEAWIVIDPATTAVYPTIVRKNPSTTECYLLRLDSFGAAGMYRPAFSIRTTFGLLGIRGLNTLPTGVPLHLAGTYDGVTMRIYVNGVETGSSSWTGSLVDTGGPLQIGLGDGSNSLGERFRGSIDAVRLWNRALTATEIVAQQHRELIAGNGLVAAWNFDNRLVDDAGGHDVDEAASSVSFVDEFATFDDALALTGDPQFVRIPHAAALAPQQVTVEAHVKLDAAMTHTYPTIVRKNVNSAEAYTLRLVRVGSAYAPQFNVTTAQGIQITTGSGAVPFNTPVHICGTFDGARVSIYVNGQLRTSRQVTGAIVDGAQGDVQIGRGDPTNSLGEQFVGVVDAVRIWNRALTNCEVVGAWHRELRAADGLVAAWNFDHGFADESGNGHHGVSVGASTTREVDSFRSALRITDAASGHVRASSTLLKPKYITVEAAVEIDPDMSATTAAIVAQNPDGQPGYVLGVHHLNGRWGVDATVTVNGVSYIVNGFEQLQPGVPVHLAMTFDGRVVSVFVNGVLDNSRVVATGVLQHGSGDLRIGRGDALASSQFVGKIDAVRIWGFARRESEILATMHREFTESPGLLGSWPMNGDLNDRSGRGSHGSAVGTLLFVDESWSLLGVTCQARASGSFSTGCSPGPSVFASHPVEPSQVLTFGCYGAPASAPGMFIITNQLLANPIGNSVLIYLDLNNLLNVTIPASSDSTGNSRSTLSMPPLGGYLDSGYLALQYFWFDPSCGLGSLSLVSSNALAFGPF